MTRPARSVLTHVGVEPIGLTREEAAEYIRVGVTKFDQMVADGRMPRPKRIDGRCVWYRVAVDRAFAALPDERGKVDSVNDKWGNVSV